MKVSLELLKELQECGNAEELVAKAAAAGVDVTVEQANAFLNADFSGDMSPEELDAIAGGGSCLEKTCPKCGGEGRYLAASGDYHCIHCSYIY